MEGGENTSTINADSDKSRSKNRVKGKENSKENRNIYN